MINYINIKSNKLNNFNRITVNILYIHKTGFFNHGEKYG